MGTFRIVIRGDLLTSQEILRRALVSIVDESKYWSVGALRKYIAGCIELVYDTPKKRSTLDSTMKRTILKRLKKQEKKTIEDISIEEKKPSMPPYIRWWYSFITEKQPDGSGSMSFRSKRYHLIKFLHNQQIAEDAVPLTMDPRIGGELNVRKDKPSDRKKK